MTITLGVALLFAGAVLMLRAMREPVVDPMAFLSEMDNDTEAPILDEFSERLSQPLANRLLLPAGRSVAGLLRGMLPSNYIERIRHKMVVAGVVERVGPEEFVALQAIGIIGGGLAGLLLGLVVGWGPVGTLRALLVLSIVGLIAPINWLQRNRNRRQDSVRHDLPDILDLLAISVEAGVGLEGAIEIVGRNFDTPLAHEMGRMLREMELGVPRRTALQHLRARVEVGDFSNFILSLIQADALGMPIGRVLRTQAHEMRSKRRQWARERAGKLPVKIIFPLMVFILPALFTVVIGPAVMSIQETVLK